MTAQRLLERMLPFGQSAGARQAEMPPGTPESRRFWVLTCVGLRLRTEGGRQRFRLVNPHAGRDAAAMKPDSGFRSLPLRPFVGVWLALLGLWLLLPPPACAAAEPFDYFQNSWNVIGLADYNSGTRVSPQNELLLAGQSRLRLGCGPRATPLSRRQTKTLLEGWLPVILLGTEEDGVRYEFTLWATPLPTAKDWRAAFAWPTEGENFLNWIRVEATNPGASPREARVRLDRIGTNACTLANWSVLLEPGRRATTSFRVPFEPVADDDAFDREDAGRWLERTVQYWRDLLAKGARLEVPCEKSTQALRAAHVCQLIANDHGVLRGGEGFYDEFYIRDGGYQLMELEEAGLFDAAAKAVAAYLAAQRPDGRFETQSHQFDANGQALWTLWQYWKITGDRDWLRRAYPSMRRAAEWVRQARREAPASSPFAGLLPAAPADGEFLWDGKHHIVGYDLWNLRGLLCAADAARELGEEADARDLQTEADAYRSAIDGAARRTGLAHFPPSWEKAGTHWGNTETLWPTELFAVDDVRVTALLAEVRERHGGGFVEGTIRWTGQPGVIHPYLSAYTTMASLARGEHERFVEEYYWYLAHSTASHAFPEGIYFRRRQAWGDTIPHVTGAANFAFLLRHALVHERGNELHLLPGAPDGWLENGREIRVEDAPTHFGPVSLRTRGTARGVEIQWTSPRRSSPARVVLHLPQTRPPVDPPPGVTVELREAQKQRWDFPTVVALYRQQAGASAKAIPGLIPLPLGAPLEAAQCRRLDLAPLANTDPLTAPFGVFKPGNFLFTGLPTGAVHVGGVPFQILDPAQNQGRALVVLQGADASSPFPREVQLRVQAKGRALYFLGNVHGWGADDDGAGDWGAVAEYVIHYADGQTQTVPLINHRTADDWASPPDATDAAVGLRGDPWHLNVLGATLRPVAVDRIVFRDLGTPAAPVLVAVTLEE